jgi:hypothetical protein
MTMHDNEAMCSVSPPSSATTTTTTTSDDKDDVWMGSEPNLLDRDEEKRLVQRILTRITTEEKAEVERVDTTIPIRHLRAFKVRCIYNIYIYIYICTAWMLTTDQHVVLARL